MKKIGLVGWWAGNNEGDNYIKFCLNKKLRKDFNIEFIQTPQQADAQYLNKINSLDFLLIGGGGLFTLSPPSPFDVFDRWAPSLKVPFGFLGVGIQEIKKKYKPVIKKLVDRSTFFVVRDKESLRSLTSFSSNIILAPDLTFLYPRRVKKQPGKNAIGVNLRKWDFDKSRTYENYKWCLAINRLPAEKKTIPLSLKESLDDRDALSGVQGLKSNRFNIDLYKDIDVLVGMRLHSLIFAVQNAIPVMGIAYTPKIKRFLSDLEVNEFCLELNEYKSLGKKFKRLKDRRAEISEKFSQYTKLAQAQAKACTSYIKDVIKKEI